MKKKYRIHLFRTSHSSFGEFMYDIEASRSRQDLLEISDQNERTRCANLAALADRLDELHKSNSRYCGIIFNMTIFAASDYFGRTSSHLPVKELASDAYNKCGTACCALGHAAAMKIGDLDIVPSPENVLTLGQDWVEYGKQFVKDDDEFSFIFGMMHMDEPGAAADRINCLLECPGIVERIVSVAGTSALCNAEVAVFEE